MKNYIKNKIEKNNSNFLYIFIFLSHPFFILCFSWNFLKFQSVYFLFQISWILFVLITCWILFLNSPYFFVQILWIWMGCSYCPFGALVWKTFKSLRSEASDQRQMDLIVFKTVKNVILWEFCEPFTRVDEKSDSVQKTSHNWFAIAS